MKQIFICEHFRNFEDEHVFNPCITHISGDVYLVGCRVIRKFATTDAVVVSPQVKSFTDTRRYTWDITHPWFGSIDSSTWWKAPKGSFDATRVLVARLGRDGTFIKQRQIAPIELRGVDARVINVSDESATRFMFTFNVWIPNQEKHKCGSTVAAIAYQTVRFENARLIVEQTEPIILCPTISECVEKNWAFWATKIENLWHISFQYNFNPHHVIVSYKTDNIVKNHCNNLVTIQHNPNPFFVNLCKFFGKAGDFEISLSTPPILLAAPFLFMGVGHVKTKWQNVLKQPRNHANKLQNFLAQNSTQIRHPILVYMMFFYLFNTATAKIMSMSHFFTVQGSQLVFPCGLTKNNTRFVVSCGNLDSEAFLLQLDSDEINQLLSDIDIDVPDFDKLNFVSI